MFLILCVFKFMPAQCNAEKMEVTEKVSTFTGNIAKAHSKDKKTRYYYYCKNTVTPTGHECSFRLNIEQTEINKFVAKVISAMVNNPRFVEAIQAKIGTAVDTEDMQKQIAVLQGQLK